MNRLIAAALMLATARAGYASGPARGPDFEQQVAPILVRRCLECHAGAAPKGGLDLRSADALKRGGKHGAALVPGQPDKSLLWERIDADEMPPRKPLPDAEKRLLHDWIKAGAAWSGGALDPFRFSTEQRAGYDWWSLRPVQRPIPPAVKQADWARTAVDRFILAGLEAKGWCAGPEADRRTLIRRLSFDLLGLPPSPAEVEAFVRDRDPAAYEQLVDRLLASPRYGERWARHWLDVVRFGESHGFEFDELRPNAWPYRDWVIQSLNSDLPYDEFARRQIAGDALAPDDAASVIPTGFLVAGGFDTVGQKVQQSVAMKALVRQEELEEILATFGQTFLGLTVHCARCHDHKFDPVRQHDYYRLAASLDGVRHGERDLTPAERRRRSDRQLAERQHRLRELHSELTALDTHDPRREELLGALFDLLRAPPAVVPQRLVYAVSPSPPGPTHLLLRGEPGRKGALVTPGGVAALGDFDFSLSAEAFDRERRRALAHWLTDRRNPLFARVMVNRLWHYHFGAGLVETPSDFGFNGGRPSHPELLDWLADEFGRQGYSLKAMHRLLVTSAVYRQSSRANPAALAMDAGNRLLWRKTPLRLEAEAIRDSVLAVAGQLNPKMGGPGYQDFEINIRGSTYFYNVVDREDRELQRRSIYRTLARGGRNRLLDTLDCPDPSAVTPRRALTTTPLQALSLLNNSLLLRMADRFAERIRREAHSESTQIVWAYTLALGRPPTPAEADLARQAVAQHGLAVLCRALFNSNEFMYVD